MSWVLIVAWTAISHANGYQPHQWPEVAMQEFGTQQACQFASVEAQKLARGIRVVCVPKGDAPAPIR